MAVEMSPPPPVKVVVIVKVSCMIECVAVAVDVIGDAIGWRMNMVMMVETTPYSSCLWTPIQYQNINIYTIFQSTYHVLLDRNKMTT